MPTWMLRAMFAVSVASFALNGVVAYIVVTHTRGAVVSETRGPIAANLPGAAAGGGTVERRLPAPSGLFQRQWEYIDKATGRRLGVALTDDTPRLEQFVRQAGLAPAQEVALRDRWAARRNKEMAMARQMAAEGIWRHDEFRKLQRQFWDEEYRALPSEQAMLLPPDFIPVN